MSKHVKVAHLLGSLNRGGTETLLLSVMNHTEECRYEMMVICRYEGELLNSYIATGVHIVKLSTGPLWNIGLYLFKLRRLLKKNHVTVVHAHQSLDTLYGFLASLGLDIKIIQTLHGFGFESGIIGKLIKKLSFRVAKSSVFVSNTQRNRYLSDYNLNPDKTVVIYNGLDKDNLPLPGGVNLKKSLNINDDKPMYGMVGNFSPGRDHMTIARFLDKLNQSDHAFNFVFIGGKSAAYPQLFEDCRDFCSNDGLKKKVFFTGSRNDINELLLQLDAFVYSTRHDTFGLALIEAIAAGIPVFVNDWEVMKEITANGTRANLYRSGDVNDLLEKFKQYYINPDPYIKKAKENAAWAMNEYSIQKHIIQLNKIYTSLIN